MKNLPLIAFLCMWSVQLLAQNTTLSPTVLSPPKLTYDAILGLSSPQEGDVAYDITFKCLRVYTDGKWLCSYQDPANYTPNMLAIASAGGTGFDQGQSIAVDGSGNVYITGYFSGTAAFGSTSKTSAGSYDIFVAKYDNSGSLQWVQTAGGTGADIGYGIAVDGSGNVYITGYFFGTATFGSTSKTAAAGSDIFVAKYTTGGTLQWVQSAGGMSTDVANGIVVDGSGNVYITGYFQGTATFGSTPKTSAGSNDVFVAKYTTGGSLQWVQTAGGTGADVSNGIAVDGSGNVYITGYFSGTATFGAISKTSGAGSADMFVAKYDPVGVTWSWVQTTGGNSFDTGFDIDIDDSGNVYLTGSFFGTATFSGTSKTSAGEYDIFVAKYTTGGTLQWVLTAGGTGTDLGDGIAVDGSGNVYLTGYFTGTATFGSTPKTSAGSYDIFVAKYTSNGVFQWVQTAGGTIEDYGQEIAIDSNGNLYGTGYFSGTATFSRNTKTSAGSTDVFIVRIDK